MKASLKFREEKKPLFRAKVPLSILGLPFQSGIVAGEAKELSLNLGTFFESGPSFKVAYRPNDGWNPFSLVVKTGTGPFGSPISSSMLMSAEFNLLGKGTPSFMLHFKPQFGDFSIKKSHASSSVFDRSIDKSVNAAGSDEDSSIEVVEAPGVNGGFGGFKKITVLPPTSAGDIAGALSGVEVAARTSLPVKGRALLNFRWAVRVPAEVRHGVDPAEALSLKRIPFLVMNKIGIEHVDGSNSKDAKSTNNPRSDSTLGHPDMAEGLLTVKRQLEVMQAENGLLRRAVEDLRHEMASGGKSFSSSPMEYNSVKYRDIERNAGKTKSDWRSNDNKKMTSDYSSKKAEGEVTDELKKALKGSA